MNAAEIDTLVGDDRLRDLAEYFNSIDPDLALDRDMIAGAIHDQTVREHWRDDYMTDDDRKQRATCDAILASGAREGLISRVHKFAFAIAEQD